MAYKNKFTTENKFRRNNCTCYEGVNGIKLTCEWTSLKPYISKCYHVLFDQQKP